MNDPKTPLSDPPEYIPDPEKEKQAKAVHGLISVIRLLGAMIAIVGLVIATNRMPAMPAFIGYFLVVLGLAQMWFMPVWIVRRYVKARVAEEELARAENERSGDPDSGKDGGEDHL